ncbi:hypothetical protein CTA2_11722 [Colletotrichum tanaceti]|uniref:Ornithine decarboxylase antizyme n=1 Tax=Colletotrichum tanaceti TaxID=1306861 RepID=A0A4U6X3K2_9PEZI|nr:hypothetical protein CTA2_11722 [Colletotrichum tanaceti]TKW49349.1 hypothetical protein CTA1_9016 [Colletotrichum tanaceti]
MASMNQQSNYSRSNYGEAIVRQANVLASCYIVDSAATLRGLHYCTTGAAGIPRLSSPFSPPPRILLAVEPETWKGATDANTCFQQGPSGIPEVPSSGLPSPPSSPPLAAITASNELALLPKASSSKRRDTVPGKQISRRGGAALSIREECERFFCESMRAVFRGETDTGSHGSGLHQGVYNNNNNNYNGSTNATMLQTPPPDDDLAVQPHSFGGRRGAADGHYMASSAPAPATAWLEVWDFTGGASFRAFVADDGTEKSLFALFDRNVIGRDLKPALMALMELVDGPLNCQHLVICVDRGIEEEDAKSLMKSLQWVGFELTTLDHWARDVDVTSNQWLFMSMEI